MADPSALDPLFFPRRIGIAGLSARQESWGARTLTHLRDGGFAGEIVAVAPRSPTGLPAVDDLGELDAPLDLLLVALPATAVPPLLRRGRETGTVRSALVYSAGFREAGTPEGAALEDELVAAVDGAFPVVGPNCVGMLSLPGATSASVSAYVSRTGHPPAGPVAIVSQSGALGMVMASYLERHGVAPSYYVSVGNEACVGIGEFGAHLLARDDVQTLGLYVEAVRDPAALRSLGAQARRSGKRVVALKAGTSADGSRATLSHTAAVAGDALLFRALCAREGIVLAESDESFADLLHAAQRPSALPPDARFAVVTMTGGGGAILADRLADRGMSVPATAERTRGLIAGLGLPSLASDRGPVDLGGSFDRDAELLPELFRTVGKDADVDAVVGMFTFGDGRPEWYREIADTLAALDVPAWMIWNAGLLADRAGAPPGVVFDSIESFVRGLPAAVRPEPDADPPDDTPWLGDLRPGVLSELDARRLVEAVGIRHVPTAVVDPADVPAALAALPVSERYVAKVDSPAVAHRARVGLVRLDLGADEVPAAVAGLAARAAELGVHDGRIVLQPQLLHRAQLVLGGVRDPQYGPAVVLGGGGAAVESAGTTRHAVLADAGSGLVERMVTDVARRHGPLDEPALATAVTRTAALLRDRPELSELDVNPVLVLPDGTLTAVDALAVVAGRS